MEQLDAVLQPSIIIGGSRALSTAAPQGLAAAESIELGLAGETGVRGGPGTRWRTSHAAKICLSCECRSLDGRRNDTTNNPKFIFRRQPKSLGAYERSLVEGRAQKQGALGQNCLKSGFYYPQRLFRIDLTLHRSVQEKGFFTTRFRIDLSKIEF